MSSPQRVRTRELTPTCDPHPPFLFAAALGRSLPLPSRTGRGHHTRGTGTKMIAVIENIAVIVVVLVISGVSALGLGRLFLTFVLKARRPS